MKQRIIVLMIVIMAFALNVFAEMVEEKNEQHECTTECKHDEIKKECSAECAKPCKAAEVGMKDHKCDEQCEIAQKHVCSSECKSEKQGQKCELAEQKKACNLAAGRHNHDNMNENKTQKKGCR